MNNLGLTLKIFCGGSFSGKVSMNDYPVPGQVIQLRKHLYNIYAVLGADEDDSIVVGVTAIKPVVQNKRLDL